MKPQRNCLKCKKKIPLQRLKALPETRLCVKCSQIVGGDFETIIVEENTDDISSKPIVYRKLREID